MDTTNDSILYNSYISARRKSDNNYNGGKETVTKMGTNTVTTNDVRSNKKAAEVEAEVARLYDDCNEEAKAIIAKIVRRWQTKQSEKDNKGIQKHIDEYKAACNKIKR